MGKSEKSNRKRKTLQELTITDSFLFGAVMLDPENCRVLLERILEFPIDHVEIVAEKSIIYHPEYKGIRLDVYAEDDKGTRFDVEMQVRKTPLGRRSRYYHSHMDMEMLQSAADYDRLPDSYVIFICDYQPYEQHSRYRYSFRNLCQEDPNVDLDDGVHTIILSNRGTNDGEVPAELVSFLQFTKKSLEESTEKSEDPYIGRLQESIRMIKADRVIGEKYMTLQEYLSEELEEAREEGREEGKEEGRIELITELINDGTLTIVQGAEKMNMSVDELKKVIGQIGK